MDGIDDILDVLEECDVSFSDLEACFVDPDFKPN